MKRLCLAILSLCLWLNASTLSARDNATNFSRYQSEFNTSAQSLTTVLYHLFNNYVDTVDMEQLTEVAIKAMLKELDPHTTYLNPKELSQMREGLDGGFEGIGVSFRMLNDTIVVIHPVTEGPSYRAGIEPGDLILSCNDSILAGKKLSNDGIKELLRGPRGSIARLGIMREGETEIRYIDVRRDKIPVYSAQTYYMVNETIGYIYVERFAQSTAAEVESAIEALQAQGMEDLIIDLQGNGGGYLNAAVDMASLFIEHNQMVVYTEGRADVRKDYKTRNYGQLFKGKLAVLMDEQSASASEIFAGCIQDYDRGVIIGRRSFGKGLVQRPIELPNGGLIRLTMSHYFTPSGRCIQKPYTKGNQQDYHEDLLNRLHSGELVSADSIHLADSLKYYTQAQRIVYGGGGIMPDVFVPLDTARTTPAHRAVMNKTSMVDYILDYFRHNYQSITMQFPTLEDFANLETGYEISDELVQGVIDKVKADSVNVEGLDSLLYNDLFRTQITAYLANDVYEVGGYKRIINTTSNAYLNAIEVLADDKRYLSCLQPK